MPVRLYYHGLCKGNPGPSAAGWAIYNEDLKHISQGKAYLGQGTNNQAEASALLLAIRDALAKNVQADVQIMGVSDLVIKHV